MGWHWILRRRSPGFTKWTKAHNILGNDDVFCWNFLSKERELCIFYFPPFLEWNRLITHEDNILSIEGFDWNWCLLPPPHLSLHEVNLSPKRPIFPRRRDLLHFLTHKCSKPSSFIPDIENRNKKVEDPERFSSDTSSTWIFVLFLSRVLLRYMYIIFGYTLYIFGHILHTSFAKCNPVQKLTFCGKLKRQKTTFSLVSPPVQGNEIHGCWSKVSLFF